MEVHPPDHPIMTVKQFFIHMGIVVLSLLIALCLEQSVEWLHHRHQHRELIDQLHKEAERNIQLVNHDIPYCNNQIAVFTGYLKATQQAKTVDGQLIVDLSTAPAATNSTLWSPTDDTWTIAKAAGLVPLLTQQEALLYARLDIQADQYRTALADLTLKQQAANSYVINAEIPGKPGLIQLPIEQRAQAYRDLQLEISAWMQLLVRLQVWQLASNAIVHNAKTEQEMEDLMSTSIVTSN